MAGQTTTTFLRHLGARIAQLRKERGITQVQLAASAQVTAKFLSEVERGRTNVSVLVLRGMALGLRVPLSQLVAVPGDVDQRGGATGL